MKALLSWALLLILASFGFATQKTWAGLEYGAEALFRSYPLSASLTGRLGYGLVLWGDSGRGDSPWYGYVKPELKLTSVGTYNAGALQFKIFPISFLGFVAGGEMVSNSSAYQAYDCDTYRCVGKSWQTYVEANLALALGPAFLLGKAGHEDWHQAADQDRDFINPTYGLVTKKEGDRIRYASGVVGYKYDEKWTMIYTYLWAQMQEIKGQSQMHLGLAQWSQGAWKVAIGAGTFESEIKDEQFTALFRVQWHGTPTLELF
ncbi:MAG: hypothetical protein AB7N80_02310 [Bdellovibrionales bacterium]